MDYIEHRKKAAELFTEARALVDKPDATEAELTRAHELTLQAEALRARADKAEAEGKDEIAGDVTRKGGTAAMTFRGLRSYSHEQQLSGTPQGRVGDFIRGCVTGRWDSPELRQMATSPGADGGYLVPQPLSEMVVDLARANSVSIRAGMQTVMLDATTLDIATVLTDPTATWTAENAEIIEGPPTLDAIQLKPMKLAALVRASKELIADAPNASAVIEMTLRGALGVELDRAALVGTGVGEPRGVLDWVPVGNVVDMLGNPIADFTEPLAAIQLILEANGPMTGLSMVMSPHTYMAYEGLVDALVGNPLQAPDSVKGLRKFVTTSMPDDTILVGDWSQVVLGLRLPLTLDTSYSGGEGTDAFAYYQVLIRAALRADIAVLQPGFFSAIVNVG